MADREEAFRELEERVLEAVASGDERLVRRWSRSLREAQANLAWAEAELERARTATR